jgi:hypothetical protein
MEGIAVDGIIVGTCDGGVFVATVEGIGLGNAVTSALEGELEVVGTVAVGSKVGGVIVGLAEGLYDGSFDGCSDEL